MPPYFLAVVQDVSAHFFSEPGMPINQIYGVWGNLTMGRNRGFAYANDYVVESFTEAVYFGEGLHTYGCA